MFTFVLNIFTRIISIEEDPVHNREFQYNKMHHVTAASNKIDHIRQRKVSFIEILKLYHIWGSSPKVGTTASTHHKNVQFPYLFGSYFLFALTFFFRWNRIQPYIFQITSFNNGDCINSDGRISPGKRPGMSVIPMQQ